MAVVNTTNETELQRYLRRVREYPLLSAEEEVDCALRWQRKGDAEALDLLVGSHLRLAVKIAMGFRGYGLPVSDLISEGSVGLMQAADRFDPDRGFRFSTYASWWIRAAIQEYILHSWSLVKMGTTASQKKLFFNLRKLKAELEAMEEGDLRPEHVESIATRLGVPEQDVISMNRRLAGPDNSLNAPLGEEGSGEWQDWLVEPDEDQETRLAEQEEYRKRADLVKDAMSVLNDRERRILSARRLSDDPMTLEELSHEYGISRERVRQIEARAFEKLQQASVMAAESAGMQGVRASA
ncbi:MAG: RNA polymerase sigma factor RpoH [Rhodovibrionaceae bacterium]|nr:RNA polymerase sigma factor RpoH [Rhodovibrionaceae bacterium]